MSSSVSSARDRFSKRAAWKGQGGFTLAGPTALLAELGDPQDEHRSVLIGGSNGKGSTTAMLDRALRACGYRCALIQSPYLTAVEESVLIGGEAVGPAEFDLALERVLAAAERIEASTPLRLSQFEVLMATCFEVAHRAVVDWMVVEVGLGGRSDVTNVIREPRVSVITTVALEHTEILGATLTEIAREKSGIMRTGRPCVVGRVPAEALAEISRCADEGGTPLIVLDRDYFLTSDGAQVMWQNGDAARSVSFPQRKLPVFLRENLAVAARAAIELGVDRGVIADVIHDVRVPGRFELFAVKGEDGADRVVVLDGAHNAAAVTALERSVRELTATLEPRTTTWLSAFLARKRWRELAVQIAKGALPSDTLVWTSTGTEGSASPEECAAAAGRGSVCRDAREALRSMLPPGPVKLVQFDELDRFRGADLIICSGSLTLVGSLRPALLGSARE